MPTLAARVGLAVLLASGASPAWGRDSQELEDLSESGKEKLSRANYDGALADWTVGLQLAREQGDKKAIALFEGDIGVVYWEKGVYPKALEHLNKSLATARAIHDRDDEANALANIGMVYLSQGRFADAVDNYTQAKKIAEHLEDEDREKEIQLLNALGNAYTGLEKYPEAEDSYTQALKLLKDNPNLQLEVGVLGNLGLLRERLDDYAGSVNYLLQALRLEDDMDDPRGRETLLGNLGHVLENLGDDSNALSYDMEAAATAAAIGDRSGEANARRNIGNVLANLGAYAKAVDSLSAALLINEDIGDRFGQAELLSDLGRVHMNVGDRAKALDAFTRAIAIKKDLHASTTGEEVDIGKLHLAAGELDEAAAIFTRARDGLDMALYYLAAGKPKKAAGLFARAAALAEKTQDADTFTGAYIGLGTAAERLGDLKEARHSYTMAVSKLELQRTGLSPGARGRYFSGKTLTFPRIAAYEGRARVAETPADAFYWSENAKARLFIESLAQGRLATALPADLAKTESGLATRVASINNDQQTAFLKKETGRFEELAKAMDEARAAQTEFIAKLRRDPDHSAYAAIRYPQPLQSEQIDLRPGEVLLEYEVTDSETLLFILAYGNPVQRLDLPATREQLQTLVGRFRKPLNEPCESFSGGRCALNPKFAVEAGAKLFDLLLRRAMLSEAPAEKRPLIAAGSKLIIVPDGVLGALPFEALVSSAAANASLVEKAVSGTNERYLAPSGVRYVFEDHDVVYAQSATALTLAREVDKKQAPAKKGIFVLADPVFDPSESDVESSGDASVGAGAAAMRLVALAGDATTFPRLEATGALARDLAKMFAPDAATLTRAQANETRLRQVDLAAYRYLVFATHGILDRGEPSLALSQVGNAADQTGFLTTSDVLGLKLNAQVAALTACKTGLGDQVSGEGVMGLGRAFQSAKARNVLMSLWSVELDSTALMTKAFFQRLKQGSEPVKALREARLALKGKGYENPFFWAPFILMGE